MKGYIHNIQNVKNQPGIARIVKSGDHKLIFNENGRKGRRVKSGGQPTWLNREKVKSPKVKSQKMPSNSVSLLTLKKLEAFRFVPKNREVWLKSEDLEKGRRPIFHHEENEGGGGGHPHFSHKGKILTEISPVCPTMKSEQIPVSLEQIPVSKTHQERQKDNGRIQIQEK